MSTDQKPAQPGDEAAVPEGTAVAETKPTLYDCPVSISHGDTVVHVDPSRYVDLIHKLIADGYDFCADLSAVDYQGASHRSLPEGVEPQRFEVVVQLRDMVARRIIRVRCQVPEDRVELPSLFAVFTGTEAMEREVFDLMGIVFADHPDLTRILMPDDWEGHPLRKDYGIGAIPVRFKSPLQNR